MMPINRHPYGVRLRPGSANKYKIVNIVPQCYYTDARVPGGRNWADMWFDFNWVGWIKPQIDFAFTLSGVNGIKFNCCGVDGDNGPYPATALLATRLRLVCAYVASKGGVVYISLAPGASHFLNGNGSLKTAAMAQLLPIVAVMETIPNVIGLDRVNEFGGFSGATLAAGCGALNAALATVTSLPSTYSIYLSSVADWTGTLMQQVAPYVDFHDGHPYYSIQYGTPNSMPAAADLTAIAVSSWYKGEFLVGEVGVNQGVSTGNQTSFLTGLGAMIGRSDCFGGVIFSAADYDITDGNAQLWGMTDKNVLNPRSTILNVFKSWPSKLV